MLNGFKITARLLMGFGILLVIIAGLSALTVFSSHRFRGSADELQRAFAAELLDQKLETMLYITRMNAYAGLATGEAARWQRADAALDATRALQKRLLQTLSSPADRAQAEAIGQAIDLYQQSMTLLRQVQGANGNLKSDQALRGLALAGKAAEGIDGSGKTLRETLERLNSQSQAETAATIDHVIDLALLVGGLSFVLGLGLSVGISRSVILPLNGIIATVLRLGQGAVEQPVEGTDRRDEIAPLAQAIEQWRQSLIAAETRKRQDAADMAARDARQKHILEATGRFETQILALLTRIKQAVEALHRSSDTLSANAEQTRSRSEAVAQATEEASVNVHSVSAAGNQLTGAISEISAQVQRSAEIARAARTEAEVASGKVSGLQDSAQKIGEVVNLINDIASQTNLLALNATIEAARAGEAGKGFAVVAGEVKHLANQTGKATEDIAAQVANVQAQTQDAVNAITSIGQTIVSLNEMATIIAGAVEEQGAAAADIARNVAEASSGTSAVAHNIQDVTQATQQTTRMAEGVFQAANGLLEESATLEQAVEAFLADMRAA
ncbi:putative methyl-accepting chemotaxis protein YoaH [mine drainage metagenome]|uniref:Putative methyl-accepting chemotaxis protein YoaH n=1 Tax=mine drainage metagenome TaxID=410659 RepID=A0A1J5RXA6_9ZZZZ